MSYTLQDSIQRLRTATRVLTCLPNCTAAIRAELERRISIESLLSVQIGCGSADERRVLIDTLTTALEQLRSRQTIASVAVRLNWLTSAR